jgi:hypothetical protein
VRIATALQDCLPHQTTRGTFRKTYLQAVQQPQQILSEAPVSAQRLVVESSMWLMLALLLEELMSLQVSKLAFRNQSLEM